MNNEGVNEGRRRFLIAASSAVGAVGAAGVAVPFVKSWNPSAKAKAAGAPIEVDVSKVEPGQMTVNEWRGLPVFVVRRTEQELEELSDLTGELRDPNSEVDQQPEYARNEYRSIKPELLVVIGKCTHLGCSPKFRPEPSPDVGLQYGGFFCPCHGSKFDMAGRVYKGVPAPTNLVVPPYGYIKGGNVILVGVDPEETAA